MTDAACQACHREQYRSFADGHPDFGVWPYERSTGIAFDHASHQTKHFPGAQQSFACTQCHTSDADGERQLTLAYETACAQCHDKSLVASLAEGVPLLRLPTLDVEALADAGHDVRPWPAEADGDFDGPLAPYATLLLSADPRAGASLETLAPTFDFYDVDPDNSKETAAAADLARALRALVDDLAARGQAALVERLAAVFGRAPTPAEIELLAGRWAPADAAAYRERWFGATGPNAAETIQPAPQRAQVPAGGVFRDDATLSLRYPPIGHADAWLRAWLDALAVAAAGPHSAIARPLLEAALKPTAAGQCGSCHQVERDSAGRFAIHWRALQPNEEPSGVTRFSHKPHVLQPQLHDCTACHAMGAPGVAAAAASRESAPHANASGFAPMTKSSCVVCHTPAAAGNACTQCHRYHAGSSELWAAGGRK